MRKCPTCGETSVAEYITVLQLPQILFPVSGEIRHEVPRKDISSYRCLRCGHVFTDPLSAEDAATIYENLYRYYPYGNLESMNAHYRRPFEEFFSMAAGGSLSRRVAGGRLLEVGCSAPEELRFFEEQGFAACGIDPGAPEGDPDPRVVKGYYEEHAFDQRFDVVVSRFVLEHANSAGAFLRKNHGDVTERGAVFVQVPNVLKFVKEFVPLFLAHEHVNYFNAHSLACAAQRVGFEFEGVLCGESPSLVAALSRSDVSSDNTSSVGDPLANARVQKELDRYLTLRESVAVQVEEFFSSRSDVCLYGAGLCLAWILYELGYCERPGLGSVVDDNSTVRGLYMPNSDLEVSACDDVDWKGCKTVLLTLNPIYHEAVRGKLQERGFAGEVFAIGNAGLVRLGEKDAASAGTMLQ